MYRHESLGGGLFVDIHHGKKKMRTKENEKPFFGYVDESHLSSHLQFHNILPLYFIKSLDKYNSTMKTPRIHNHTGEPKKAGGSGRELHYGGGSPVSTAQELGLRRTTLEGDVAIQIENSTDNPITDENNGAQEPWWRRPTCFIVVLALLVIGAIAAAVSVSLGNVTCCAPNPYLTPYFADLENLRCEYDPERYTDSDKRPKFFASINECCSIE